MLNLHNIQLTDIATCGGHSLELLVVRTKHPLVHKIVDGTQDRDACCQDSRNDGNAYDINLIKYFKRLRRSAGFPDELADWSAKKQIQGKSDWTDSEAWDVIV
ncbi:1118_t:CDS:2 [Acaulospora colombiana]|uniref:1118_t:CDS:1 n=1 Tax=Acaulospora colombiana TaxID=27376 RepID=A0ACA9M2R5_9GLOM|nr:1118_t:CDS:2 [Acaulospora colombiana]